MAHLAAKEPNFPSGAHEEAEREGEEILCLHLSGGADRLIMRNSCLL